MWKAQLKLASAAGALLGSLAEAPQTVPPATKQEEARLIGVLESDRPLKEKVDACRGLAVIGSKQAVPALARLLGHKRLSHMARYGLEPIPDAAADEALRQALGRLKGRLLAGLIGSIGVRRDAKATTALVSLLEDPDTEVAQAAAKALGKIATVEAADALRQALAKAPQALRPAVADGCLACAEGLLAQGNRDRAAALYEAVGKAGLPKHFRLAAAQGAILVRQPAPKP